MDVFCVLSNTEIVADSYSRSRRCFLADKVTIMTTLTEQQFHDIFENPTITAEVDDTHFEVHHYMSGLDEETEYFESYVVGSMTIKAGEHEISLSWQATGGSDTYQSALEFDIEVAGELQANFVVLDEDGDEVDLHDLALEIVDDVTWEHEVRALLPEPETEELDEDTDEDSDMETIIIQRDNDKDLKFTGENVASASSSENSAMSNYSGSTGRWTELNLYKTKGGKFVCEQIGYTCWQGEHTRRKAVVCETEEEIIDFFGQGWLAKDLYESAGIENVEEVE